MTPRTTRRTRILSLAAASTIGLLAAAPAASAAMVEPQEWDFPGGPPVCADGAVGIRIDDPSSGTVTVDGVGVQVTVHNGDDGPTFDFVITSGHLATTVVVKGGPNQNAYLYPAPGVSADTGLHAPVNPNNDKFYGLSHLDLCVDEPDTPDEPHTPVEEPPTTTPTTEAPPVPEVTPLDVDEEVVVPVEVKAEAVVAAPGTLPRTGASSLSLAAAGVIAVLGGAAAARAGHTGAAH